MKTATSNLPRRLTATALTAALAAPLALSATFAQAAPQHTSAVGFENQYGGATIATVDYRDNRGRNRRNRGRNNRNRYDRNVRQNFSGIVTSGGSGNQFQMRTSSGRSITVIASQSGQARKISRGDRVTVAGYFRGGNVFYADDLNFIRNR